MLLCMKWSQTALYYHCNCRMWFSLFSLSPCSVLQPRSQWWVSYQVISLRFKRGSVYVFLSQFLSLSLFWENRNCCMYFSEKVCKPSAKILVPFPLEVLLFCWGCCFGWQGASETRCSTSLPAEVRGCPWAGRALVLFHWISKRKWDSVSVQGKEGQGKSLVCQTASLSRAGLTAPRIFVGAEPGLAGDGGLRCKRCFKPCIHLIST